MNIFPKWLWFSKHFVLHLPLILSPKLQALSDTGSLGPEASPACLQGRQTDGHRLRDWGGKGARPPRLWSWGLSANGPGSRWRWGQVSPHLSHLCFTHPFSWRTCIPTLGCLGHCLSPPPPEAGPLGCLCWEVHGRGPRGRPLVAPSVSSLLWQGRATCPLSLGSRSWCWLCLSS